MTTVKKSSRSGSPGRRSVQAALDHHTFLWWALLSSISLFNVAAWLYTYRTLDAVNNGGQHPYQRYQLYLSGIYVFVCAYRSVLPRIDLERYTLFDTFASSIFLGRAAATIAEVAFSCQIALFIHQLAEVHGHPLARLLAIALVPMIVIAQCFCWCGVVTLNHLYHAIEESIWAFSSLLVGSFMASLAIYHPERAGLYSLGLIGAGLSAIFFVFMVTVDVPMYIRRWKEGRRKMAKGSKLVYMDSFEGAEDAWQRRVVKKNWDVWREESVWLTGYFSSAVWLSLYLVHMPTSV
jgi:hypothetical protein